MNLTNKQLAIMYEAYNTVAKIKGAEMDIKEIIHMVKLDNEITKRFLEEYLPKNEEE